MRLRTAFFAVTYIVIIVTNTALHAAEEKQSGEEAGSSTNFGDVLVSTLDVSLPPTGFETAATNVEKVIRERFANVPKEFVIRFHGPGMASIGITKSGGLADFKHEEKTVTEILTAFVADINYNRKLGDPSHNRQRVVWTVAPHPSDPKGPKAILITSRFFARQAGYRLPLEFLPEEMRGDH